MGIEKKQTLTPKPSETMQVMDDHITIQNEVQPLSYASIDSSAQRTEEAIIDSSEKFQKPRTMSNVSSKIQSFNQKNKDTPTPSHNEKMQSSQSPNQGKRKRRKKRKKKTTKQTSISDAMSHLRLTRWFKLDKNQLAKFHSPSFKNSLENQLEKLGIMSLNKGKKLIKLQISRRIPLPKRQSHWKELIQILQTKLGGHPLIDFETMES